MLIFKNEITENKFKLNDNNNIEFSKYVNNIEKEVINFICEDILLSYYGGALPNNFSYKTLADKISEKTGYVLEDYSEPKIERMDDANIVY